MSRRFVVLTGMLFLVVLGMIFLSRQAELLLVFLVLLSYIKHRIYPIKKEFLWFVLVGVICGVTEMVFVNVVSMWSYLHPQLLGIPVYMPVFWGFLGITTVLLYDELIGRK